MMTITTEQGRGKVRANRAIPRTHSGSSKDYSRYFFCLLVE